MRMNLTYWILAAIILIFSCEEEIDWPLDQVQESKLVVDAIITNEIRTQEVKLNQSISNQNEQVIPIEDAQVFIRVNEFTIPMITSPQEPGIYKSVAPFSAIPNADFHLQVFWNNKEYTAVERVVPVAPIPAISFTRIGESNMLRLNEIAPIYNQNQQAMYEVFISWAHITGDPNDQAKVFYYTFNSVEISGLLRPPREEVNFPQGSILIINKYGLSEDFADFIRAMVLEYEWSGGFVFGPSGNAPGNIMPDALGYFAVSGVERDTIIAQ